MRLVCVLGFAFANNDLPTKSWITSSTNGGVGIGGAITDRANLVAGVTKGGPERQYPDTVAPSIGCPDGFEQQGRACVSVQYTEITATCPDGFSLDPINSECIAKKRHPAKLVCPEGSVMKGSMKGSFNCEVLESVAPMNVCDAGWQLEGNSCVKQGASMGKSTCPEGYKLAKNGCIAVSKVVAELKCPHNFELNGKRCESWVYENPTKECPPGYTLIEDNCVRQNRQQPKWECARGVKSPHTEQTCYIETILKPQYRCGGGTNGNNTDIVEAKGKVCEFVLRQDANYGCPTGFEKHGDKCLKIEEQPLQPYCDAGFKLEGDGHCVRSYTQKADVACPEGTLTKNGACVVATTAPAEAFCPRGYKLEGGLCQQVLTRVPIERCPRGYKPTYKDECEMIVSIVPEVVCPTGFVARAGTCEATEVTPSITICENGTEPTPDGRCRKIESKLAKVECRSGYQLSKTGECMKPRFTNGVYFCEHPEDQVIADECETISRLPVLAECPKGYIGVAGQCQKTEILEAKLECPRKYKLKSGLCYKVGWAGSYTCGSVALAKSLLLRELHLKAGHVGQPKVIPEARLVLVGGPTENALEYNNICVRQADHDQLLELLEGDLGGDEPGDCFEGLLLAVDEVLKSISDDAEAPYKLAIHVLLAEDSPWDSEDGLRELYASVDGSPTIAEVVLASPDLRANHAAVKNFKDGGAKFKAFNIDQWKEAYLFSGAQRFVRPVTVSRLPIEIGTHFKLPCYVYLGAKDNPLPSLKKGVKTEDGIIPVAQHRMQYTRDEEDIPQELGEEEREEITRAYVYGNRLIPLSIVDMSLLELPKEEKSLKVIYAVNARDYEQYFVYGSTNTIVPDPTNPSSFVGLKTLCRALEKKETALVARFRSKANYNAKMVLLTPAFMPGADSRTRVPCLVVNNLPYRNDVKNYKFINAQQEASQSRREGISKLIKDATIDPPLLWNPLHRNFLKLLIAKYLNQGEEVEEQEFYTLMDSLNVPSNDYGFNEQFGLAVKSTSTEQKLASWKRAIDADISLDTIFSGASVASIEFDSALPLKSLDEHFKSDDITVLQQVVARFGDLLAEDLLARRGRSFIEWLRHLRALVSEREALTDAYNALVEQALGIIKLDRETFAAIEGALLAEPAFVEGGSYPAERVEELLAQLQAAPKRVTQIATQSTQDPVAELVADDAEFDELE